LPSNKKAKLATLIIQHWCSQGLPFTSFVVFQDLTKFGPADVARLNNVNDASISSLDAISEFRRKLERLYGSPDASAVALDRQHSLELMAWARGLARLKPWLPAQAPAAQDL
jgi:hypothetical protein